MVKDDDGSEKIELSELERVYGKEIVAQNLRRLTEGEEGGANGQAIGSAEPGHFAGVVHAREPARAAGTGQGMHELVVLRERVRSLEEQRAQLESHQRRERDQFQEEIANLREGLQRAQEQASQLTRLLTDQTGEQAGRGADQDRKLRELESTVGDLKKMNIRVLRALKAERSKTLWQRLFG